MEDNERVLILAGISVGALLLIFLITFATGWAPRFILSFEARLVRLPKKRKKWSWTAIEPGVLLGSIPRLPCHLDELKAEGVGAVLTLNEKWELYMSPHAVQDCNMLSRQLPTPDFFAPSQRDLVEAVTFIRSCVQQGMSVYVHCNGGKGRSAVCVMCYLIHEHNWTPDEAFQFVKGKRKIAKLKGWCGLHKQWRAVKRFARELKAARKQLAYMLPSEEVSPQKPTAKVAPLQLASGDEPPSEGQTTPGQSSPDKDCEAQVN